MTNARLPARAGFTLIEVLIAGVVMAILCVGALLSLKSTTGFATRTGRSSASVARALEWGEPMRNQVQPNYTPRPPQQPNGATQGDDTLMQQPFSRTAVPVADPCFRVPGSCPGGGGEPVGHPVRELQQMTIQVQWNEPKN